MTQLLERGREVLTQQPFSVLLKAKLLTLEPGKAVLELPLRPELLQQHGHAHGGVVSYLLDNTITFAAGTVLGENLVTAEFKVNYLRPARGERLQATARVEQFGSHLAVCRCEVMALQNGDATCCAIGQGTVAARG